MNIKRQSGNFNINYDKCALFIFKYKVVILLIFCILTLLAFTSLSGLRVRNDSNKFSLNNDDPVIKEQQFADSLFGSSEYVFLLIESDSTIDKNLFRTIYSISGEIKNIKGVKSVYSITDAEKIEWKHVFNILIPSSVPVYLNNYTNFDLSKFEEDIRSSKVYVNNVVSGDFKKFNIIINIEKKKKEEGFANQVDSLVDEINNIISNYSNNHLRFYLAGTPLIDKELSNVVRNDLKIFVPLSIIISLIILFFAVRSLYFIISVIFVSFVSLTWSLSAVSISDTPLSIGLSVIVPLILVINIAYSLHYIYHYQRSFSSGYDRIVILKDTLQKVLLPSLMAGLTTAAGFFSLMTSSFEGIREIGAFIGTGILFSMFSTNILLPALLGFKKPLHSRKIVSGRSFLTGMCDFTIANNKIIISFFLLITGFSVYGITRISMDTNLLNYIDKDIQIRKSFDEIDKVFGGTLPLEIIVSSKVANVENNIAYVDSLSKRIGNEKIVGSVLSVTEILKSIDNSKPTGKKDISIPYSYKEKIFPASLWKSIGRSGAGSNFVTLKDSMIYFKISCRIKSVGSERLKTLLNNLNLHNKDNHPKVTVAGIVPFFVETNNFIINSQMKSFITAFIIVFIFFLFVTRSFRTGLISIIPNLQPIVLIIGLMGIINIPLDLSNIMIASIAIGIIVDDTIHFLYNYSANTGVGTVQKIRLVYSSISLPVFATSIIVAAGFFILGFSNFLPTKYFGILSGILVIVALVADLMLLPSLLIIFDRTK